MINQQITTPFDELVDYFIELGNFDHPNIDEIAQVGESFNVSKIETVRAFFVARERASLKEGEFLDGGDGTIADGVKNFGEDSIYQMLFENRKK